MVVLRAMATGERCDGATEDDEIGSVKTTTYTGDPGPRNKVLGAQVERLRILEIWESHF
jgi:hypothetical protein